MRLQRGQERGMGKRRNITQRSPGFLLRLWGGGGQGKGCREGSDVG